MSLILYYKDKWLLDGGYYTNGIMKLGRPTKKNKKQKLYVQVLYTLRTNIQNDHTSKQKHKIFVIMPL